MTKDEFNRIFEYIFAEEQTAPGKHVRVLFFDQFGKLDRDELMTAARLLKQRKTFGPPKCFDLWECLRETRKANLPPSLTMSASEALALAGSSKLLVADAERFADRAAPEPDPQTQYESPEELDRANRIHRAIWEREFKQRFERQQQAALQLVERGTDPKAAILEIAGRGGLVRLPGEQPVKALLDAIQNGSWEVLDK